MDTAPVATTVRDLRIAVAAWRAGGRKIALVPTMGALHAGHRALVREAGKCADNVVVSIFVNPAQFAPHEDFDRYPRDLASDLAKLGTAAHLVYAPAAAEMYPEGSATRIEVGGPSAGLESDFRPHFFAGVATVVAKLLIQCAPDFAMFGEKDYQQLQVVKRLVRDMGLPVEIVGVPTAREEDGLALSSRNAYLSADGRRIAGRLNAVLGDAVAKAQIGLRLATIEAEAKAALVNAGFDRVDYVAIRDAETLQPIRHLSGPARVLAAVHIGGTRLIDNMAV